MNGRTVQLAREAYCAPGALYIKMERRNESKRGGFNFQMALFHAGGRHRLMHGCTVYLTRAAHYAPGVV